ncbi:MAG: two-component system, NarL family, sensor histidine kinase BarA [Clostridiales bacterium]|nr:two-component system, NarL family, sensor histidine kinase BarA [Clostridiales bacterium]
MEDKMMGLKWNLLNQVCCILLVFNRNGAVIEWNETARQELGYHSYSRKVNILDIFRREFRQTKEGIAYINKERNGFAYRRNETCFPVEMNVYIDEGEENNYGILSAVNISDRIAAYRQVERAKESAEHALQVRNDFVSIVTHELRTPVNGIKGIASALRDTSLTDEQLGLLGIIERCCNNMTTIINDLLDFSKLEAGKFSLEERKFRFREFMDRAIEAYLPTINEKGLTLRVNITPTVPEFLIGDELRLMQIINNLLSNSIKFTNVGQISIEVNMTEEDENGVVELFFMVIDTGIGIDKQDMDKLFKDFSQVDASITRRYGGTGLGLSITKQLVELMQGNIFVQSERGKGSTFSFSVRLRRDDGQTFGAKEEPSFGFVYSEYSQGIKQDNSEGEQFSEEEVKFDVNQIFSFGSEENQKEVFKNLEKLSLCIEMSNWEKAEEFAKTVKILIADKEDLKRAVFRLELAIRNEAAEKSKQLYEILEKQIEEVYKDEYGG